MSPYMTRGFGDLTLRTHQLTYSQGKASIIAGEATQIWSVELVM